MLLIYGVRTKTLSVGNQAACACCTTCGRETLQAIVLVRYFHVFWIPMFPVGKTVVLRCGHCMAAFSPPRSGGALDAFAREAKAATRMPLTVFAGLAIIALLTLFRAAAAAP